MKIICPPDCKGCKITRISTINEIAKSFERWTQLHPAQYGQIKAGLNKMLLETEREFSHDKPRMKCAHQRQYLVHSYKGVWCIRCKKYIVRDEPTKSETSALLLQAAENMQKLPLIENGKHCFCVHNAVKPRLKCMTQIPWDGHCDDCPFCIEGKCKKDIAEELQNNFKPVKREVKS